MATITAPEPGLEQPPELDDSGYEPRTPEWIRRIPTWLWVGRRADRADGAVGVHAHALPERPVLDGRGDHDRDRAASAGQDPPRPALRRQPAAVLHAAAPVDQGVRRLGRRHPLVVGAVRDPDDPRRRLGRLEAVRSPRRRDGGDPVRVQRLADLVRAGDAHVRADGTVGRARHDLLRARVRRAPAPLAVRVRRGAGGDALHPLVGHLLLHRLGDLADPLAAGPDRPGSDCCCCATRSSPTSLPGSCTCRGLRRCCFRSPTRPRRGTRRRGSARRSRSLGTCSAATRSRWCWCSPPRSGWRRCSPVRSAAAPRRPSCSR